MAAKAYEMLNQQLAGTGLAVRVPATRYDVPLTEVRAMVERMGGHAVIKVPYANAGAWGVEKEGRAPTNATALAHTAWRVGWTAAQPAGQGVFTVTRQKELDDFLAYAHQYDNLIVQSLVGNSQWSSSTQDGTFYHVGTVPDRRMRTFVADLRMMVCSTPAGFMPVALYARRSRKPLQDRPDENPDGAARACTPRGAG